MKYSTLLFLFLITPLMSEPSSEHETPNERDAWRQSTYQNKNVKIPEDFNQRQIQFSNSLPTAYEGFHAKGNQISSQTWMPAGPNNIGGRSRAVEHDLTNPNIIITGGVSGGIWRSVDGGKSWVQSSNFHEIPSVTAILQDPRPGKNHIWYCAGGESHGNSTSKLGPTSYHGNGIFKSTDNGVSWYPYGKTSDNDPTYVKFTDMVYRLAIDPTKLDEDILYAACRGAVIKIDQDGQHYTKTMNLEGIESNNLATDLIITPNGKYFATLSSHSRFTDAKTTHSGMFYSENGEDWKDISPTQLQPTHRIVMDYAPSNENILYFLTVNIDEQSTGCDERHPQCNSIFKLEIENNNFEWTDLSANLPYFNSTHDYNYLITHYGYCSTIKVAPENPNIVLLAGANCFISYDGFATEENTQWIAGYNPNWDRFAFSDTTLTMQERYQKVLQSHFETGGVDFHWFDFNPNNHNELLSASDQGIHKLPDISKEADKNWITLNNGFCTTQFFDCAIDKYNVGSDLIIGGLQDNNIIGNLSGGDIFNKLYPGDGQECYITNYNSIIISYQLGYIMRVDLHNGMPYNGAFVIPNNISELSPQQLTTYAINKNTDKEIVIPTNAAISICKDITSENINDEFEIHPIDNLNATCIDYSYAPETNLIIGTINKRIFKVTDLSNDNFSYEIIDLPDYVTGNYISDIWTDHKDNNHFFAIVSNYLTLGMLETTDGGETWTDHGGNLEEFPDGSGAGHSFRCYERVVYEGDTLHLLGTSDGLFSTKTLSGENTVWTREGENTIGRGVIEDIEFRELDGRIVVATHGNGLFKTNYATSVQDFDGNNLGFVVSEVYPNPASNQINFVVNSDNASFVEVKLVDLNGRKIATIISEDFTGTKKVNYNINGLNTGTYFLQISDGNHYVTKKVNVVR